MTVDEAIDYLSKRRDSIIDCDERETYNKAISLLKIAYKKDRYGKNIIIENLKGMELG